jgi:hypothetical protein
MRRRAGLGPLMAARSLSGRHRHRMSPLDPNRPDATDRFRARYTKDYGKDASAITRPVTTFHSQ